VQGALAADAGNIGILVRARAHLAAILPALRSAGIAYAAVELDSLGMREVTLDLRSLAHALIQPNDRLAWLCVLRAPWCGLSLPDLVNLGAVLDDGLAGLCRLADLPVALTEEGRVRVRRVIDILQPVFDARGVATLADRVRSAWLALGGRELAAEPIDRDAARQFFELLAASEQAGDLRDWDAFCEALDALHARPEADPDVRVQVMTLHRAKGLQFDTVIMPGLANVPRASAADLLQWRARPHGLMLAPIDARGGEGSALYAYLASLAVQEGAAELGRVLYVGATRARTRLHLTAVLPAVANDTGAFVWKDPRSGSALERLWSAVSTVVAPPSGASAPAVPSLPGPPLLRRVPANWRPPIPLPWWTPPTADAGAAIPLPAFDWAHATAAAIGTVAHRLLADVARDGVARWSAQRIAAQRPRLALELAAEGVPTAERDAAADKVLEAVDRTLADERGRWLFASAHADARSEWALAGVDAGKLIHVTLDRTFVAEGARWIVDFKTGQHEGGDVAAFLDREQERYRAQLERYARIVGALEPLPVELALYYPLVPGGWRHWSYDPSSSPAELR
jgi:ATP-dependent exoDNAse (exonuclease V) beta subunit